MGALKLEQLSNGNLKLSVDDQEDFDMEIESWKDPKSKMSYENLWWELCEGVMTNSEYSFVAPENIGALTDSVIIGEECWLDDDGKFQSSENAKFWWCPQYEVSDPIDELKEKGEVIFIKADIWQ